MEVPARHCIIKQAFIVQCKSSKYRGFATMHCGMPLSINKYVFTVFPQILKALTSLVLSGNSTLLQTNFILGI